MPKIKLMEGSSLSNAGPEIGKIKVRYCLSTILWGKQFMSSQKISISDRFGWKRLAPRQPDCANLAQFEGLVLKLYTNFQRAQKFDVNLLSVIIKMDPAIDQISDKSAQVDSESDSQPIENSSSLSEADQEITPDLIDQKHSEKYREIIEWFQQRGILQGSPQGLKEDYFDSKRVQAIHDVPLGRCHIHLRLQRRNTLTLHINRLQGQ